VLTAWLVNQRITKQFRAEATRSLETADSVFRSWESLHAKNLLLRFSTLPTDPRYKSAFQGKHLPALRDAVKEIAEEQGSKKRQR